jgi:formylglycine-generating enzyme required for sulfatase activity
MTSFSGFVRIPEGWFLMGSDHGQEDERPVHRVWVDGFELATHPVTWRQYDRFLRATGHQQPPGWRIDEHEPRLSPLRDEDVSVDEEDLPAIGVSWLDAQAYCAWHTGLGHPVRLPTEAEWERAARGNHEGWRYPWGNEIPAWIPNGGRGSLTGPWPVALGEPTDFGLYGIASNIHEWCMDWYAAGYYAVSPERNPTGPTTGTRRASRGGSWRHAVTISRCATRSRIDPAFRYSDYGFRLARTIGAGAR